MVGRRRHAAPSAAGAPTAGAERLSRTHLVASTASGELAGVAARAEPTTGREISIRVDEPRVAPMETQMERFKLLDGRDGARLPDGKQELARRMPDGCQLAARLRWRQLGRPVEWATEGPSADEHRLSIERHPRQPYKREHSHEQYRPGSRQTSDTNSSNASTRTSTSTTKGGPILHTSPSYNMSDQQRDATATPLSSSSLMDDPLVGLSGTNRATTTERRTTTTTTTKRVVKSSDDFMPSATDIQQVRSESRTGSISSTSPLFGASSLASNQQQQSQSSKSTTTATTSSLNRNTSKGFTEGFSSPIVQETDEGRVLKLRFDLTQYEPDEILVKTVDNRLTVHAKHEEKSESKSVYREYNREFHLPEGTDVELIRSTLSKDGVLTVDLPLPKTQLVGSSRRIPIDRI